MARYCSAQDNVRTRQSPPYRETIRANVLHGTKSMSWAKSVLPRFTGTSSETFRKVPDRVQIDTTLVRQNRVQNHALIRRHRLLNRTAVISDISYPNSGSCYLKYRDRLLTRFACQSGDLRHQ